MKLVTAHAGKEIKIGDEVLTFRGERVTVLSITAPHKPESTGRVKVRFVGEEWEQEFFPGVINAKIVV